MRSTGPLMLTIPFCALLCTTPFMGVGADVNADLSGETSALTFPSLASKARGTSVLLAIDDYSLPIKSNLCLYLSKPEVRREPVLTPSRDNPQAPDFIGTHFYGTVLHDAGTFRMWYYGLHFGKEPADLHPGPVCYAESADGIRWTKPNLGQVDIKGSRDNNAIKLPDDRTWFAGVIKDDDDPDPSRRYKMVYDTEQGSLKVRTATSPDGIRWAASPHFAIETFLEMSSFYKHDGLYVVNGQFIAASEGGHASGRQGGAMVSPNFDDWIPGYVDAFRIQEPADPAQRGSSKPYDQVHLGVGGTSLGNVVVGLFGLWHNHPGDVNRNIPASWFGFNKISCDLSLVISNDGLHFREPVKGHVYISQHDSPVTPLAGKDIPTILIQSGNGILNVGDETRIYHGRWRNSEYGLDYWAEVALATLPRDRWGALGLVPNAAEGNVWSTPVTLPDGGTRISLNADGAQGIRVEIANAQFGPLSGFSGDDAGRTDLESGLDCPVQWAGRNLNALGGRTVRFRIHLDEQSDPDPRLYAIYLRSDDQP